MQHKEAHIQTSWHVVNNVVPLEVGLVDQEALDGDAAVVEMDHDELVQCPDPVVSQLGSDEHSAETSEWIDHFKKKVDH